MHFHDFENNIVILTAWFNKPLDEKQLNIYFQKIKHIPNRAYKTICEKFIETLKPTPSKFPTPKDFMDEFLVWKSENPKAIIARTKTDCKDCNSTGFLWIKIYSTPNLSTTCCFRCASCENWLEQVAATAMPSMNKKTAIEQNLEILYP